MLRNVPKLETLTIGGTGPPTPMTSLTSTIGSHVLLPCLSTFTIHSDINHCNKLLDHISYPSTSLIIIRPWGTTNSTALSVIRVIYSTLNPERLIKIQPPFQYLKINSPPSSNNINNILIIQVWDKPDSDPNVDLYIYLSRDARSSLFGMLRTSFWGALPLEDLQTLHLVHSGFQESLWTELCPRLERLTVLKLGNPNLISPMGILKVLSSTIPTASQGHIQDESKKFPPQLYIPALQRLSISGWDFETLPDDDRQTSELLLQLISVLRMRREHGAEVEVMDIEICRYPFESGVEKLEKVVSLVNRDESEEISEEEEGEEEESECANPYHRHCYRRYSFGIEL